MPNSHDKELGDLQGQRSEKCEKACLIFNISTPHEAVKFITNQKTMVKEEEKLRLCSSIISN